VVVLRKRVWLIIITMIVVSTIIIAFWVNDVLPPPPDFSAPDAASVSPHYLSFVPVSWRDVNETRIFLEATSPRYGYSKN
jgi:hypothetical protein